MDLPTITLSAWRGFLRPCVADAAVARALDSISASNAGPAREVLAYVRDRVPSVSYDDTCLLLFECFDGDKGAQSRLLAACESQLSESVRGTVRDVLRE